MAELWPTVEVECIWVEIPALALSWLVTLGKLIELPRI